MTSKIRDSGYMKLAGIIGIGVAAYVVLTNFGIGAQRMPTVFKSNGEQIYYTGTSVSGLPIRYSGGTMHMQMNGGSCAACHGVDREGGRAMPRFWKSVPPITAAALFGDHDEELSAHGDHDFYDATSLRKAITQGIDPEGNALDQAMPRWSMSEPDLSDLIFFLKAEQGHSTD